MTASWPVSDGAALAGALGGEAQDSDLRVDAEQLSGLSGLDSHLSQLGRSSDLDLAGSLIDGIGVVDVDGAVAHSDALQALFAAVTVQNEAGAHQMATPFLVVTSCRAGRMVSAVE